MIEIVIIRDPDFANDIHVFGGSASTIDIDLGRADLSDPDEFADWAEDLRVARELTVSFDAQRLIEEVVRDAAENFDHACPGWAR